MSTAFLIISLIYSAFAFSASDDASSKPVFQIQRVYLKEISIEQPNSPAIFLKMDSPKLDIKLGTGSDKLNATTYESTVSVVLIGKIADSTAFIVKAKQAGIFTIENISNSQMDNLLGSEIPNILYPYLRANVADAIARSGFPPIHIAEIDWHAWAQQHKRPSP